MAVWLTVALVATGCHGGADTATDLAAAPDHTPGSAPDAAAATAAAASSAATAAPEPLAVPCDGIPIAAYLDVDRTSPHAGGIDCARWLDLVGGTAVDAFSPTAPVRRDQMASIVARAITVAGGALPAPDRGRFRDVDDGNRHRDAIERLAVAGVVEGRGDGRFDPAGRVPRGQMTAFLIRALTHLRGEEPTPAPDAFTDDDGHPHETTIDQAAAAGLVAGRSAGRFVPDAVTDRAETATFITRWVAADRGDDPPETASFRATTAPLPASLRRRMTGVSWRPGCPVGLDELRLVEVVHHGMDDRPRWGLLVVHRDVADDVAEAFRAPWDAGFRIQRMRLVDHYDADDDRSMAANNTSAFNCRTVAGTDRWSQHAYGHAIDVNPVQNPYVRGDEVDPPAGAAYTDRDDVRPGMIVRPGPLLAAFERIGWSWGGDWRGGPDYQHLSRTGS
jgi:hypothetical protein